MVPSSGTHFPPLVHVYILSVEPLRTYPKSHETLHLVPGYCPEYWQPLGIVTPCGNTLSLLQ